MQCTYKVMVVMRMAASTAQVESQNNVLTCNVGG